MTAQICIVVHSHPAVRENLGRIQPGNAIIRILLTTGFSYQVNIFSYSQLVKWRHLVACGEEEIFSAMIFFLAYRRKDQSSPPVPFGG